jgi:Zn-dependent peptidase ImmA (M78 family)
MSGNAIDTSRSGLLERLRAPTPPRALTSAESLFIAERQAALLLSELGIRSPAVSHLLLAELPFLIVARRADLPTSGMTTRTDSGWVVVLRSSEPQVRQRFSLAHELKHVLDDPFISRLYSTMAPARAAERAERVCDYFAACLLMPKRWLTRDWYDGRQNIASLAARYQVSRQAMEVRLTQLGLLAPTPRCLGVEQEVWV